MLLRGGSRRDLPAGIRIGGLQLLPVERFDGDGDLPQGHGTGRGDRKAHGGRNLHGDGRKLQVGMGRDPGQLLHPLQAARGLCRQVPLGCLPRRCGGYGEARVLQLLRFGAQHGWRVGGNEHRRVVCRRTERLADRQGRELLDLDARFVQRSQFGQGVGLQDRRGTGSVADLRKGEPLGKRTAAAGLRREDLLLDA